MTVATTDDIEERIGRPLNPDELAQANAYLRDIEVEIRRYNPDILTEPEWKDAVVSVSCAAVIRAGRFTTTIDQLVPANEGLGYNSVPQTSGALYLRRSERRTLGLPLTGSVAVTPVPECSGGEGLDWGC